MNPITFSTGAVDVLDMLQPAERRLCELVAKGLAAERHNYVIFARGINEAIRLVREYKR